MVPARDFISYSQFGLPFFFASEEFLSFPLGFGFLPFPPALASG